MYNNSKVDLYGLKAKAPVNSFPILVKEPQLKVNGHTQIEKAYLDGYLTSSDELDEGGQVDLEGQLAASIAFVDKFDEPYYDVTKTRYITYLQSLAMDGKLNQDVEALKLPGDIYYKSTQKLPLVEILASPINIVVLLVIITMAIVISMSLSKKKLKL